jgi:hypothetical protein
MAPMPRPATFRSYEDYRYFEYSIKRTNRSAMNKVQQQFLKAVRDSCDSRKSTLPKDKQLYRAQAGTKAMASFTTNPGAEPVLDHFPYDKDRMKPTPEYAKDGRANSKGIPALYLSDDAATALAEMRPWVGSHLTLAPFTLTRDVSVVDCTKSSPHGFTDVLEHNEHGIGRMPKELNEGSVWSMINDAFSQPVAASDNSVDYAPTQVLADLFRDIGFDGIVYRSSIGLGQNLALFDLSSAECDEPYVHVVETVSYQFRSKGLIGDMLEYETLESRSRPPWMRDWPIIH